MKKSSTNSMNKVWIELERPRDEEHGKQIAALANNMLKRLIKPEDQPNMREFFWDAKDHIWCIGNDNGYITLSDNGEWFNLDYIGQD